MSEAADGLLFDLVTAALYHRGRLTWFASLHRFSMFLNVLFGTGAVASLLQTNARYTIAAGLLMACVSAASLAFDFAGMARKHEDRRRTYHDLAAQLEESAGDDAATKRIRAKLIRAAADDPYVFKAAEALAYNAAIKSLGLDKDKEFVVCLWARFMRNIITFSGTIFKQRDELKKKNAA